MADDFKMAGAYVELNIKDNTADGEAKVRARIEDEKPVELPVELGEPDVAKAKKETQTELDADPAKIPTTVTPPSKEDTQRSKRPVEDQSPAKIPTELGDPVTTAWKAKLNAAIRDVAVDSLNIPATPEMELFRSKLSDELAEIRATVHGDIPIEPADLAEFHVKLDAAVKAASESVDAKVPVHIDNDVLRNSADEAAGEASQGMLSIFSDMPIGVKIAAAVAIGGPLVGAAMSGIAVAGLIGIGVALQKGDPGIQRGWNALVSTAKDGATRASSVMVAPITSALDQIRTNLASEQPAFEQLFAGAAGDIPILTSGLDSLVDNALPGLTNMVDHSQPIMRGLSDVMGDVGSAISEIADDVADNSDTIGSDLSTLGAIVGDLGSIFGDLLVIGTNVFAVLGPLIEVFADGVKEVLAPVTWAFGLLGKGLDVLEGKAPGVSEVAKAADTLAESMAKTPPIFESATTNAKQLTGDIAQMGSASTTSASQISALQDAVKTLADGGLEKADDFAATFYQTLDTLSSQLTSTKGKVLDANGALNLTSERGRDVQSAVESARNAMVGYAQSATDANVPSSEINGHLQTMYGTLEHDLLPAFGGNKKAVDAMLTSMGLVPKQIATDVTAPGAVTSTDQIKGLLDKVGAIPVGKSIKVDALTSQAIAMLQSLGLKVTTLPDGSVKITATTKAAAAAVDAFIRAESGRTIFVPIKGVASPSTGKPILGPYHATGSIDLGLGRAAVGFADGGLAGMSSSLATVVPPGAERVIGDNLAWPEAFIPLNGSQRSRDLATAVAIHENVSTGTTLAPTINNYISVQDNDSAVAVAAKTSAQTQWDLMTMRTG